MRLDYISQLHRDIRTARLTRRGSTMRVEDVTHGAPKEYPRMARIVLPELQLPKVLLQDALDQRSSTFKTLARREPFTREALSALLSAARSRPDGTRPYPSGGRLYPIEIYFIGTLEPSKQPLVYHYLPEAHALEALWEIPLPLQLYDLFGDAFDDEGARLSGALVFTAQWHYTAAKYGDFGYSLTLFETGHLAQNILLIASGVGISARPMGRFTDAVAEMMLDIDSTTEQAVYAIALI